ncbi:MAG: monovalent cation/H(+) antiporter subunit G [Proteobacteria bacterium]|nr:monovalent cation/H(+) antiporter subunit G [Pseudomonadota bacterium]
MAALIDIASWALILGGVAFSLIGAYGMIKLSDVYARMHAASLIDTLGIGLIFIGMMLQAGFTIVTVKLVLVLVFILFTSPVATHALARAAINEDVLPVVDTETERQMAASNKTKSSEFGT